MLHVGCLKYWNIPAPPPGTGLSSMNRNRCVVVRTDYSGRGTEISSPSPIGRDVSGGENFLLTHFGNLGNSLRREMTRDSVAEVSRSWAQSWAQSCGPQVDLHSRVELTPLFLKTFNHTLDSHEEAIPT